MRTWTVVLVIREAVINVGGVVDGVAQKSVDSMGIVVGLVAACLGIGVEVGVKATGGVEGGTFEEFDTTGNLDDRSNGWGDGGVVEVVEV